MALSPRERICLTNSSPKSEDVPVMNQVRGLVALFRFSIEV